MSQAPSLPLIALLGCGLGVSAAAQGVIITDGQVSYSQTRPTPTQSDSPSSNFTANPPGEADISFEDGWYYRIEGDAANEPLKADGMLSITNAGSHSDANWADVDGRGLITIFLDYDAVATSASSGVVTQRVRVQNISGSPLTVHLFHYVDMDVQTTTNQTTGVANRQIVDNLINNETGYHYGPHADNTCVDAFSGSECGILTGLDLDGSAPPFNGDYSGAFQYTFEDIPPVTTIDRVCTAVLGHNENPCAWGVDIYGTNAPVSTGIITIEQDSQAAQDGFPPVLGAATASVGILRNWPQGVNMLGCKGITRIRVPIRIPNNPDLHLQVDPLICFNLSGLPPQFRVIWNNHIPNDPAVCGVEVHHQLFALDTGAPNGVGGYPKSSSWTIGDPGQ